MKNLKKINLLLTVIGLTTFILGSILQTVNMRPEAEIEMIIGLNQMTYFGAIALILSLLVWVVVFNHYVFTDWNWLKTKTKSDDIAALGVFILFAPILLSLLLFTIYDLVIWYEWYIQEIDVPLFKSVYGTLGHLESNMVFWFIFVYLFSVSSALAIFLYKAKTKKQELKNQQS